MARVLYLFVVFGYVDSSGGPELLDPEGNALFKGSLSINGAMVNGQRVDEVDWRRILAPSSELVLGTYQ